MVSPQFRRNVWSPIKPRLPLVGRHKSAAIGVGGGCTMQPQNQRSTPYPHPKQQAVSTSSQVGSGCLINPSDCPPNIHLSACAVIPHQECGKRVHFNDQTTVLDSLCSGYDKWTLLYIGPLTPAYCPCGTHRSTGPHLPT